MGVQEELKNEKNHKAKQTNITVLLELPGIHWTGLKAQYRAREIIPHGRLNIPHTTRRCRGVKGNHVQSSTLQRVTRRTLPWFLKRTILQWENKHKARIYPRHSGSSHLLPSGPQGRVILSMHPQIGLLIFIIFIRTFLIFENWTISYGYIYIWVYMVIH